MNYLNRPIFPFCISWDDAIERDITYDLRETLLGYGAEFFVPTATYTTNAWDFPLYLQSGAEIIAFEAFCDSLVGRLNGFWLPCPLQAAIFSAAISATQFKILAEGLADTWNSRPDQHLLFTFPDGTQAAGQIQGVAANDDGTETVTMTAPLPEAPASGTVITRLHYVRFANDSEEYEFDAENVSSIKLTVVELPMEYTNVQTGLQPIYLYHFYAKAPVLTDWRYTSFAAPVVSANDLYSSFPMSHKQLTHTIDGNSNPLQIEAKVDPAHPFSLLAGTPPGRPLWVDVYLCYYAMPDNATKIFSGYVSNVTDDGVKYTAKCDTRLSWLKAKAPKFLFGSTCNWNLFDATTCKVGRAFYQTQVTLQSIGNGVPPTVYCSFDFGFQLQKLQQDDWFTGGTLETGAGVQYELRSIISSYWNGSQLVLQLNLPLRYAKPGAPMQVTAGCDKTWNGPNGCQLKFNNFANFGGFVAIPQRNLSLQGIQTSVSQGGKKI
jgi:uncharacterized phage protein (TIGR02218 family)